MLIKVEMGVPITDASSISLNLPEGQTIQGPGTNILLPIEKKTIRVSCVSMGNPHTVLITKDPIANYPLESVGPLVETHEFFPQRTNFEVAQINYCGL